MPLHLHHYATWIYQYFIGDLYLHVLVLDNVLCAWALQHMVDLLA